MTDKALAVLAVLTSGAAQQQQPQRSNVRGRQQAGVGCLRELDLTSCAVTDIGMGYLLKSAAHASARREKQRKQEQHPEQQEQEQEQLRDLSLTQLQLSGCKALTDAGLDMLARAIPGMAHAAHAHGPTPRPYMHAPTGLTRLSLNGCRGLTDARCVCCIRTVRRHHRNTRFILRPPQPALAGLALPRPTTARISGVLPDHGCGLRDVAWWVTVCECLRMRGAWCRPLPITLALAPN